MPTPTRGSSATASRSPSRWPTTCSTTAPIWSRRRGCWPTATASAGCARCGRPATRPGTCASPTRVSGKLLTGDHVLDPVTPHVGIWHEHRADPLGNYVRSLHAVRGHGPGGTLPAHGEPFPDLDRRVDELLAHEAAREQPSARRARARRGQRGGRGGRTALAPARRPVQRAAPRPPAVRRRRDAGAPRAPARARDRRARRRGPTRIAYALAEPLRRRSRSRPNPLSGCTARSAARTAGTRRAASRRVVKWKSANSKPGATSQPTSTQPSGASTWAAKCVPATIVVCSSSPAPSTRRSCRPAASISSSVDRVAAVEVPGLVRRQAVEGRELSAR